MDTEEATGSSGSPPPPPPRRAGRKHEAYAEVLRRLSASPEAAAAGFDSELWAHFHRLPPKYALDVNVERPEDVLVHLRLLQRARDAGRGSIVFEVITLCSESEMESSPSVGQPLEEPQHFTLASSNQRPTHEIIFAADDRPMLLSQLTSFLSDVGLNIQEAHAYSTNDGYSLDIFSVNNWQYEDVDLLINALKRETDKIKSQSWPLAQSILQKLSKQNSGECSADHSKRPTDASDVWDIEVALLKFEGKIAAGSCGDLYRGTYCSQDVAIKVLHPDRVSVDMLSEFAQEVFILKKVRHKNVVQFIGACTRPPILCIVTEFMTGGSIFDLLHNQKGSFELPMVLRIATDVSKGMNYLHQNNIIHRDLKSANLLMDENEVVKVADFGVARVKDQSGVMTAETGTYRWMAPEVIEHKPYDHKADIFSFGIVLWELLTGKIPYEEMTPIQAAVSVVQKGLRPPIPENTHPVFVNLLRTCWQQDPSLRPEFSQIIDMLLPLSKEVAGKQKGKFFSGLRRRH